MSEELKELIDIATDMTDTDIKTVVLFAQFIKNKKNIVKIPDRLIVNNEEELIRKIDASYANEDKAISLDEAVEEIEKEAYAQ